MRLFHLWVPRFVCDSSYSENPALEFCLIPLRWSKLRLEELSESSGTIGFLKPATDRVRIVLVRGATVAPVEMSPERRINFGNNMAA